MIDKITNIDRTKLQEYTAVTITEISGSTVTTLISAENRNFNAYKPMTFLGHDYIAIEAGHYYQKYFSD